MVKNSNLSPINPDFKPLYRSKGYKRLERVLSKYEQKTGWYCPEPKLSCNWRHELPTHWKGNRPIQFKVPGMAYSTELQVPSTKISALLREISCVEPRLAKSTPYHAKLVEKGGRPLSKFFNKNISDCRCTRLDCVPCSNSSVKSSTMCKAKSIVHESVCFMCEKTFKSDPSKPHKGKYIGQSSRSLYKGVMNT